jgi:hypothetical protein
MLVSKWFRFVEDGRSGEGYFSCFWGENTIGLSLTAEQKCAK